MQHSGREGARVICSERPACIRHLLRHHLQRWMGGSFENWHAGLVTKLDLAQKEENDGLLTDFYVDVSALRLTTSKVGVRKATAGGLKRSDDNRVLTFTRRLWGCLHSRRLELLGM